MTAMDLVVDANVLFAALIKKDITSDLFFVEQFHLYAPDFLFIEFEKYRGVVREKTERSEEDFERFLSIIKTRIQSVPAEEFLPFMEQAKAVSPDPKDAPYIAVALKLGAVIWSYDKGLRRQTVVKIFDTSDLLRLLRKLEE